MITIENEKAYSTQETAAILQILPVSVRRYIGAGKLHGQKIGNAYYFTESEIKSFAQKRGKKNERPQKRNNNP